MARRWTELLTALAAYTVIGGNAVWANPPTSAPARPAILPIAGEAPPPPARAVWAPTGRGANVRYGEPGDEPDVELLCLSERKVELRVLDPTGKSERNRVKQVQLVGLGAVQAEDIDFAPIDRPVITMFLDAGSLALTALLLDRDFEVSFPGARLPVRGGGASALVRGLLQACLSDPPVGPSAQSPPPVSPPLAPRAGTAVSPSLSTQAPAGTSTTAETTAAESTIREILARTLSRVLTVREKAGDDERFLTPSLRALFLANARDFDADPYTGSQEPQGYRLTGLSSETEGSGQVVVTAGFDLEDSPDVHPRIAYVLVCSADRWRIDDVRYLDDGHTLRQLLRGGSAAATPAAPRASAPPPAPARAESESKPLRLDTPARFTAYPAGPVYRGPTAPVILDTAEKRAFRTRLRATAGDPVAFAGEYALGLWGCGGGCVQGAVVSKRTGAITALPGSASGWGRVPASFRPFVYRADSNLLVVFGQVNEEGPVAATFYRFVGGTFVKFKVVPVPPDMQGYDAYVARL